MDSLGFIGATPVLINAANLAAWMPEPSSLDKVVYESHALPWTAREQRNGHKGAVLWFTGLSGSGKSTLGRRLEQRLFAAGAQTFCLDGDRIRQGLNRDLAFSDADRKENIRRVTEVARLAFDHGNIVICTFISPFAADRKFARSLIPAGQFIEIYVKCDLNTLVQRDPKGLYARALNRGLREFTGISSPYEEPTQAEMVVETDRHEVEAIVNDIWSQLLRREILQSPTRVHRTNPGLGTLFAIDDSHR